MHQISVPSHKTCSSSALHSSRWACRSRGHFHVTMFTCVTKTQHIYVGGKANQFFKQILRGPLSKRQRAITCVCFRMFILTQVFFLFRFLKLLDRKKQQIIPTPHRKGVPCRVGRGDGMEISHEAFVVLQVSKWRTEWFVLVGCECFIGHCQEFDI